MVLCPMNIHIYLYRDELLHLITTKICIMIKILVSALAQNSKKPSTRRHKWKISAFIKCHTASNEWQLHTLHTHEDLNEHVIRQVRLKMFLILKLC